MRYTKVGIVCMVSSTGRTMDHIRLLWEHATPTSTPITTEMKHRDSNEAQRLHRGLPHVHDAPEDHRHHAEEREAQAAEAKREQCDAERDHHPGQAQQEALRRLERDREPSGDAAGEPPVVLPQPVLHRVHPLREGEALGQRLGKGLKREHLELRQHQQQRESRR